MFTKTGLSHLNHSEWRTLSNRWAQGIDFVVEKVGKKWALPDTYGSFPLFRTKAAAYEAATKLVLAESPLRSGKE